MVLAQWPDQSLELYAFHFEGIPSLMRSVPLDMVRIVAAPPGKLAPADLKFALADDAH